MEELAWEATPYFKGAYYLFAGRLYTRLSVSTPFDSLEEAKKYAVVLYKITH